MPAGACKLILDADTLTAIGRISRDSRAVKRLLDESDLVWAISDLCAQLMGQVTEILRDDDQGG